MIARTLVEYEADEQEVLKHLIESASAKKMALLVCALQHNRLTGTIKGFGSPMVLCLLV
jgi:hypothetical protein